MKASAFFIGFALCAAATYFSYNMASLLLDPYNVVWRARQRPKAAWAVEQFRSAKVDYLARHADVYEGLILSDSRGSLNKTAKVSNASNIRFFNLSTSGDSPMGFLPKARWAIRSQTKLRTIVLILAPTQFQVAPRDDLLMLHEHPYVSGENWLSYYWAFSNLPYPTFLTSAKYYATRSLGYPVDATPVINSGFDEESGDTNIWGAKYSDFMPSEPDHAAFEAEMARDPPDRLRFHNSILDPPAITAIEKRNAAPLRGMQIDSFSELVATLKSKAVDVKCVISPLPMANLRRMPAELYFAWMELVVQRCNGAWDFSIPSSVTADNYNYWDIDHFLPHVAYAMLLRVLSDDRVEFGHRVTVEEFPEYRRKWLALCECLPRGRFAKQ
jgi:hypothetical protein